ncbi:MAG: hypothetical protein AB1644_01415 [Candidatus Zixiibacteriota bacterium]
MTSHFVRVIMAALIVVAWLPTIAASAQVRAKILQQKLDRLYFDIGEEALVFAGSRFVIFCGDDSVCAGVIEKSYEGIAVSTVLATNHDHITHDACYGLILVADVDSNAVIRIGCSWGAAQVRPPVGWWKVTYDSGFNKTWDNYHNNAGSGTVDVRQYEVIHYPLNSHMENDFADGRLDAYMAYQSPPQKSPNLQVDSTVATSIAALIPNVYRAINKQGRLTTALYRRFDPTALSSYFDGPAVPVYSFLSPESATVRSYPYDPASTKRLLREQVGRPRKVRLWCADDLRHLAGYFADVLAREQLKTEIVTEEWSNCDAFLTWLPCETGNSASALKQSLGMSLVDQEGDSIVSEKGRLAATRLSQAFIEPDSLIRQSILDSLDHEVIDEIGCFPLFRPTLHLVAHKNLTGIRFTDDGKLDLSSLRKLKPPAEPEPRQ